MRILLVVLCLAGLAVAQEPVELLRLGSYRAALEGLPPDSFLRLAARRELGEPVLEEALRRPAELEVGVLILLEARRLGRQDLLAAWLPRVREMARGVPGNTAAVARFVVESLEFERDWQSARRLSVSDFVARNDRAWHELASLQSPVSEPFLGFWLTEAALCWPEGRAALEAEYGPLPELAALGPADAAYLTPHLPDWIELLLGLANLTLEMEEAYRGTATGRAFHRDLRASEPMVRQLEQQAWEWEKAHPGLVRGKVMLITGRYLQALARIDPSQAGELLPRARALLERSDSPGALDSLTADELERAPDPARLAAWEPVEPVLQARKRLLQGDFAGALDLAEELVRAGTGSLTVRRQALEVARRAASRLTERQLAAGESEAAFGTRTRVAQLESWLRVDFDRVRSDDPGQRQALQRLSEARQRGDRASFYRALSELQKLQPGLRSLTVRPSSFGTLQSRLPPELALVQYFPAPDRLYCFVATRDALEVREVAVGQEELVASVAALRRSLIAPGGEPALDALRQTLIEPVRADLEGREVVAFLPTGSLLYVPFAALVDRPCTVLIKATDLEAALARREERGPRLVALGDPDGSLPGARREVRALTRYFHGGMAYVGAEAGAAKLAGATLLHLATHGVLNPLDPLSSYLVVAPDPVCPDGRLRVSDVAGMQLEGVSLVTLSACQTALAERDPQPGQELATLADAFGYAGAPSLVASLWRVPDESTVVLMEAFYRGLTAGETRARALREAQRVVRSQPRWAHPFYWAGFVLLGDWR